MEPPPAPPSAVAAQAQSHGAVPEPAAPPVAPGGVEVTVGAGMFRALHARPYERRPSDPIYRPLRVYALDPSASRRDGAVAVARVPYEPVAPGPVGCLFAVEETRAGRLRYPSVDLDDARVLVGSGRRPSPSDPRFHQQMVYAVCSRTYAAFRKALGRDLAWGFERAPDADGRVRLRIRPHVEGVQNAFYDRATGTLSFGCFKARDNARGRNLPGGYTFTCLSHDVVTHETTHALLDGLRSRFAEPTNPDVLAFHEGFADLVAVFQRFSYPEVVREALREARGEPGRSAVLTGLAAQMAQATGHETDSIRPALNVAAEPTDAYQRAGLAPHGRGGILFEAVFEAFLTVFERKVEPVLRLATGGSGVLPEGDLAPDLLDALVKEATTLASQFLTVCIRAVDYCPPVDLEFGEYLRALLTADHDLVPDDPWDYREALIDGFWRRGIYPSDVADLSEDALLWRRPAPGTPRVAGLRFGSVAFDAEDDRREAVSEQAQALRVYLSDADRLRRLGLRIPRDTPDDRIEPPCVQSARPSHRVGPDGQVVFDLVVEVTQRRVVDGLAVWGGATLILGPSGGVRYAITKDPDSAWRLERQRAFLASDEGRRFWQAAQTGGDLFGLLHRPALGKNGSG